MAQISREDSQFKFIPGQGEGIPFSPPLPPPTPPEQPKDPSAVLEDKITAKQKEIADAKGWLKTDDPSCHEKRRETKESLPKLQLELRCLQKEKQLLAIDTEIMTLSQSTQHLPAEELGNIPEAHWSSGGKQLEKLVDKQDKIINQIIRLEQRINPNKERLRLYSIATTTKLNNLITAQQELKGKQRVDVDTRQINVLKDRKAMIERLLMTNIKNDVIQTLSNRKDDLAFVFSHAKEKIQHTWSKIGAKILPKAQEKKIADTIATTPSPKKKTVKAPTITKIEPPKKTMLSKEQIDNKLDGVYWTMYQLNSSVQQVVKRSEEAAKDISQEIKMAMSEKTPEEISLETKKEISKDAERAKPLINHHLGLALDRAKEIKNTLATLKDSITTEQATLYDLEGIKQNIDGISAACQKCIDNKSLPTPELTQKCAALLEALKNYQK